MTSFKRLSNRYDITAEREEISVTFRHRHKLEAFIEAIVCISIVPLMFATFSILCFIENKFFWSAVNFILVILATIYAFRGHKLGNKKRQIFRFTINELGVSVTYYDCDYHLDWAEVSSFGLVNQVKYGTGRYYQATESVLYFSKNIYSEKYLRRKMAYVDPEDTTSSDSELIMLPFGIDDVEEEYKVFCEYIYRYCDKERELNYIKEVITI